MSPLSHSMMRLSTKKSILQCEIVAAMHNERPMIVCPRDIHGNCDQPDNCYAVKDCVERINAGKHPLPPKPQDRDAPFVPDLDALRRAVQKMKWVM